MQFNGRELQVGDRVDLRARKMGYPKRDVTDCPIVSIDKRKLWVRITLQNPTEHSAMIAALVSGFTPRGSASYQVSDKRISCTEWAIAYDHDFHQDELAEYVSNVKVS